jgi:hypothetical protein
MVCWCTRVREYAEYRACDRRLLNSLRRRRDEFPVTVKSAGRRCAPVTPSILGQQTESRSGCTGGALDSANRPAIGSVRPPRSGTRNAPRSVWKSKRSWPTQVATATPRSTAIIAALIAKGGENRQSPEARITSCKQHFIKGVGPWQEKRQRIT